MTGKRDKPSIRHSAGGWTVRLPGYAFNRDTIKNFPTHYEAGQWLKKATATSCTTTQTERTNHHADGIGPVAGWDPFQGYRYRF